MKFETIKEKAHILAYLTTDIIICFLFGYGLLTLLPELITVKLIIVNIICLLILKTIIVNDLKFVITKETVNIKYLIKNYTINMKDITDISIVNYDDFNKSQKYNSHRTNSDKLICIKYKKRKLFKNQYKECITLISPNSPELFLKNFNKLNKDNYS